MFPRAVPTRHRASSTRAPARSRTRLSVVLMMLLGLVLSGLVPAPATAADGAVLTIEKTSTTTVVRPGDSITWSVAVTCQGLETICEDAVLSDTVPAPFEYTGHTIVGNDRAPVVTERADGFDIAFQEQSASFPGLTGLRDGQDLTVLVTAVLPATTDVSYNTDQVTNTATVTSSSAATQTGDHTVELEIPEVPAVEVGKTWSAATQDAGSTEPLTIGLTVRNTSNVPASSLTVVDPAAGTTSPFDTVAFVGFGAVTFPQGADQVTVTANGISTAPAASPSLPAGVAAEDVTSIAVEFTSSTGSIVAGGTAGSVQLSVVQRAGIDTAVTTTVDNTARATVVTAAGQSTADATATVQLMPLTLSVTAGKTFSPATVVAGESTSVTLSATNTSNQPLDSLTITEPSGRADSDPFGTDRLVFTGFGDGTDRLGSAAWPQGATDATLTYVYTDGTGTPASVADGAAWPAPEVGRTVAGFTVTYTGAIATGAQARVAFLATASPTTVFPPTTDDVPTVTFDNEVQVDGAKNGEDADPAFARSTLTVQRAQVAASATKNLSPKTIPRVAGQLMLGTLSSQVNDSTVPVMQLVVEDSPNSPGGTDIWGAFTATEVASVTVPADTRLTVETWDGSVWTAVPGAVFDGPQTVIDTALPAGAEGLRFVYDSLVPTGLTNGDAVEARVLFRLDDPDAVGATIKNVVAVDAFGPGVGPARLQGEGTHSDELTFGPGTAVEDIRSVTATKSFGTGYLVIPEDPAAEWPTTTVDLRVTNTSGIPVSTLRLTEPGPLDASDVSAFEHLDLVRIDSISVPDGVSPAATRVVVHGEDGNDLYDVTGATAVSGARALTAEQLETATGVTVTVDGERIVDGGVLSARLTVQLRETVRSTGVPVDSEVTVTNTVLGDIVGGPTDDATATVPVYPADDQPLGTTVTKSLSTTSGTVHSPQADRTVTSHVVASITEGRPTSLTVTDDAETFWNAFDLTAVTSVWGTTNNVGGRMVAHLEYRTGTLGDGLAVTDELWTAGAPFTVANGTGALAPAAAALPAGIDAADVIGVRLVVSTTDGSVLPAGISSSGTTGYHLRFAASPRVELRTGGEKSTTASATANPGEDEAGEVTNVADASLTAPGRTVDATPASAVYRVVPGTPGATVVKSPGTAAVVPGATVSFRLAVTNTGTTVMENPVLTDVLPADASGAQLVYDPVRYDAASFEVSPTTASISTDPEVVDVTTADDGTSVTVSFPPGTQLFPGETFTVILPMQVRAGVAGGTTLTNSFVFTADAGLLYSTTSTVDVLSGKSYMRIKDVQEDAVAGRPLTGVVNTRYATECVDDEGFYRVPCLVLTQPGGTETWRLRVSNTGNLPATTLTIVDVLPHPGDMGTSAALSGSSRGSTWAPTYLGDLDLSAVPAGTTTTVSYLLPGATCSFTGVASSADPYGAGCAASAWTTTAPADLSTVTGLKIQFDFDTALQPGESVQATYRTRSGTTLPAGVTEPAPAWNSMVAFVTTDANGTLLYEALEPNKAGVAFAQQYAVGDRVWVDADADGLQGAAEAPLAGVGVTLWSVATDGTRAVVATTTTDEHGDYVFDGLSAGDYAVTFELTAQQRAMYEFTPSLATGALDGADPTVDDSDADADGRSGVFTLGPLDPTRPHMIAAADYAKRSLVAAFVDPTLDAGVVLRPVVVPPTAEPGTPAVGTAADGGSLPVTGAEVLTALGLMALLLAGGTALVALVRRRRGAVGDEV
ncbi:SdrD B-like domain-containing protein [Sanguibacter sp. 25GB23B1]|uniref:SdrD B-like domain-containing protein n=1 Tax=unclassified Sanguibacter TaxID=2645534 RepID=UPI0032AEF6BE